MSTPTRPPYQYLPITDHNGIRLIVLQPSPDKAAPVHCSILHTTLRQAREEIYEHYTALSYVWGDANDTTSILVDEHSLSSLRVTKNLECALRYLRDAKRVLYVWADGVCINQLDDDEKGNQVQQMGRVYEVAHHTVIFLGECEAADEAVLTNILSCYKRGLVYPERDEGIRVLKQILARPWFYRIWILQELVISHDPRVQIGNLRFPWWTLSRLKTLFLLNEAQNKGSDDIGPKMGFSYPTKGVLGEVSTSLEGGFEVISQMNNIKWIFERSRLKSRCAIEDKPAGGPIGGESETPTEEHDMLLSILEARRGYQASDPRDRVFAHLGLVDDVDLRVDYRMTCAQVFQAFAQQHILDTKSYEIFAHVEDVELQQRMKGVPSWVPDWTYREENPRRQLLRYPMWEERGLIENVKPTIVNMQRVWKYFSHGIRDFQASSFSSRAIWVASIPKLSEVLDTTAYQKDLDPHRGKTELDRAAQVWLANQLGVDATKDKYDVAFWRTHSHNTIEILIQGLNGPGPSILDGRRLASLKIHPGDVMSDVGPKITSQRQTAVVPASSKIGDHIYFLEGSMVPLVLRDNQEESHTFRLIGPCLIEESTVIEHVRNTMNLIRRQIPNAEIITMY
jgi:hypothetical protein